MDTQTHTEMESEIERLVGAMTLDEKTSLTAGANMWYLPPVERLGIPALKVSDGPSGVRGDSLIGRRSLSVPCGTAVGSTWNPDLVRQLGDVLAGRGPFQERARAAGSDGVHRAHAARRTDLRVLLRGPVAHGPHRRRLRLGRAGGRRRLLHKALRLQRPGARADDDQRRGRRAHFAGDPPRRLRTRGTGGRRLVRDDRLQQGQRRLLRRAAGPDRWRVAGRVGLRRGGHVRLVRDALHRGGGAWPGSTSRCRVRRPGSVRRWPLRCVPARWTSRWWTARSATSCG